LARAATSTKAVLELFDVALQAVPAAISQPAAEPTQPRAKPDFWEIWLSHEQYLRTHSLRFASGNRADAEDALSEAMLKAAQIFGNDTIRNERAWLLRLVHNACMDRHRDKRRINRFEKVISEIESSSAPAIAAPPERSPEELLSALEEFDILRKAMDALPASLADPLLRYLDEQSDAQIAESLHVTKEVIRKRRQIARDILRRAINPSI
jgi:RNA polymerase sigma factor (sigma-70 family)